MCIYDIYTHTPTFVTEASLPVLFPKTLKESARGRASGSVAFVVQRRVGGGPTPPRKDTQSNNNYLLEGISVVQLCVCVCVCVYCTSTRTLCVHKSIP